MEKRASRTLLTPLRNMIGTFEKIWNWSVRFAMTIFRITTSHT